MSKKVKGVKKLNKVVSAQLKPFGISKAKLGAEYSYTFADKSVRFTIAEGVEDELFKEFVLERFNYHISSDFIFSLLHEVGHHKTDKIISDDIFAICAREKVDIDKRLQATEDDNEAEIRKINYQYFNLPDEFLATAWAVNYAKKHPKKCAKMWRKCEKALHKFYAKNLTEVD